MNLNRILLLILIAILSTIDCVSQVDTLKNQLPSFASGDIFIQKAANDSFLFFQIANVSPPMEKGIPILKGLFLLDSYELEESRLALMQRELPSYFDTSDIYYISLEEFTRLHKTGDIVKHYPFMTFRPTSPSMFHFLSIFFGTLFFSGFIALNYLIIWASNLKCIRFNKRTIVSQFFLVASLAIIVSMITILGRPYPINYEKFGFMIIRNIIFAQFVHILFLQTSSFLKKKYPFLKSTLLSLITTLILGFLLLIILQIITMLIMEKSAVFSLSSIISYGLYDGEGLAMYFYFSSFCIAAFFYKLFRHQKELIVQQKDYEITRLNELKTKAELEALTAKTNPHFLYNSLNTIAASAKTDADKTEKMAIELSKFLKYSTNRKGTNLVSLKEEIEMVNTYLKIEKIRFEDQLSFQISIEKAAENQMIPRFLLQPLVENALKHGYQIDSETIQVSISAIMENEELVIQIKDSGAPFADDFTAGYGLDSVTKKLHLLFPNRHQLELLNTPEKEVQIRLQTTVE